MTAEATLPRATGDRRVQQLQLQVDAVGELVAALSDGRPIEGVLPSVATKAASLVGATDALISLLDDDGVLRLALPENGEESDDVVFEVGNYAQIVGQSGRTVIVNDLTEASLPDSYRTILREYGISGFMAVPLRSGERLVGVLHLSQRANGQPYRAEDASLVEMFAAHAAISIDNARLFAESRRFAHRLTTLLQIAIEMSSSLEIDEILRRVGVRARELCNADTVAIARLDETRRLTTTELAGYAEEDEKSIQEAGPIALNDHPLAARALRERVAVHAADSEAEGSRWIALDPALRSLRAVTAVPLIYHDRSIGLLYAGWRRRHALNDHERQLLETLARLAAIAYENAGLFRANSTRAQEFQTLFDLSVHAASEVNASAVIRATTEAAKTLLAADRASLRLYDSQQDLLVPAYMSGYSPLIRNEHLVRKPGQGTPGRAFSEGVAIIQSDYDELVSGDFRPEHVGLQSSLSVPLMARGRAIGVLNVGSLRARHFDRKDADLLQMFANQAALLVDNAHLLQEATEQARRLETLSRTAAILTSSLEPKAVLDAIIDAVGRVTQATFCACYLKDEQAGDLYFAAGRGQRVELWRDLRLKMGEGIVGAAAKDDAAVRIPDIRLDVRTARADLDEAEGLRAVIYAPLRARGQVIGVLGAGQTAPDSFRASDLQILSVLADHAASAIANARLYDRTQHDLRHLDGIRQIVEVISGELDLNALLGKVVRHAAELVEADGGTVSLVDSYTGVARIKGIHGLPADLLDLEIPPGAGLVGEVLATRRATIVREYRSLRPPIRHPSLADVRAGIALPIWRQDALIGVFSLFTRNPERQFAAADLETLTLLAKHAAIAITNALLYRESQRIAVVDERNRIAREIHDTLAQGLTGIILQLETAEMAPDLPEAAQSRISRAIELARVNLEETRHTMLDLRAQALEGQTLTQAIEKLVGDLQRDLGITGEFIGPPPNTRFAQHIENEVFRIAQEALANVRRHSGATRVAVRLEIEGDRLCLTIEDNGRGIDARTFDDRRRARGFGLRGMSERAAMLGGTLSVDHGEHGGTCVELHVPMAGQTVAVPR